jgi:hypothetical protein
MLIKTTFDIHTHNPVYAICNANHQCGMITTSIVNAIKAGQCRSFDEVKSLISSKNYGT